MCPLYIYSNNFPIHYLKIQSDYGFFTNFWADKPSKEAKMDNGPELFYRHSFTLHILHPSIHEVIYILLNIQSET